MATSRARGEKTMNVIEMGVNTPTSESRKIAELTFFEKKEKTC